MKGCAQGQTASCVLSWLLGKWRTHFITSWYFSTNEYCSWNTNLWLPLSGAPWRCLDTESPCPASSLSHTPPVYKPLDPCAQGASSCSPTTHPHCVLTSVSCLSIKALVEFYLFLELKITRLGVRSPGFWSLPQNKLCDMGKIFIILCLSPLFWQRNWTSNFSNFVILRFRTNHCFLRMVARETLWKRCQLDLSLDFQLCC